MKRFASFLKEWFRLFFVGEGSQSKILHVLALLAAAAGFLLQRQIQMPIAITYWSTRVIPAALFSYIGVTAGMAWILSRRKIRREIETEWENLRGHFDRDYGLVRIGIRERNGRRELAWPIDDQEQATHWLGPLEAQAGQMLLSCGLPLSEALRGEPDDIQRWRFALREFGIMPTEETVMSDQQILGYQPAHKAYSALCTAILLRLRQRN